jgi:hypothetical protein
MPINQTFSAADASSPLFAGMRAFETGSGDGNYGANTGNGAYGAYQMRLGALIDSGAMAQGSTNVNDPSEWTGTYGTSLQSFLSNPSYQDGAAAGYLNNYIVPAMNNSGAANQIGSTFTDSNGVATPITQDGLLIAGWNLPGGAIAMANGTGGPAPGTAQYTDSLSRFQAGAIVDGQTVSDPTATATQRANWVNDYESKQGSTGTGSIGSGTSSSGGGGTGTGTGGTGSGGGSSSGGGGSGSYRRANHHAMAAAMKGHGSAAHAPAGYDHMAMFTPHEETHAMATGSHGAKHA